MNMQDFSGIQKNILEDEDILSFLSRDELEAYEERSAIMEFDGGLSREEAEFRALRIILAGKMKQAI